MDVQRKVVLADGGMALPWILLGVLFAEQVSADFWWIGALIAFGTIGTAWAGEHGVVSEWATVAAVIAAGVALFAIGLTGGADLVTDALVPVGLAGMGVGLLAYRVYFGLLRPIPEDRLRRASDRSVWLRPKSVAADVRSLVAVESLTGVVLVHDRSPDHRPLGEDAVEPFERGPVDLRV